jgi:hypothetical protein
VACGIWSCTVNGPALGSYFEVLGSPEDHVGHRVGMRDGKCVGRALDLQNLARSDVKRRAARGIFLLSSRNTNYDGIDFHAG